MPVPPLDDPPPRPLDERQRYYRLVPPAGGEVIVGLGKVGDPVTITVIRPLDHDLGSPRPTLRLLYEEAWALWACIGDGLGVAGEPPDWIAEQLDPLDAHGHPLPPLLTDHPF